MEMKELLKQLRTALDAATPGGWCPANIVEPRDNYAIEQRDVAAEVDGPIICTIENCYKPNQIYIALCSPTNIKKLLDVIERAEKMVSYCVESLEAAAYHSQNRGVQRLMIAEINKMRAFLATLSAETVKGDGE